jgi:hypothetical protein
MSTSSSDHLYSQTVMLFSAGRLLCPKAWSWGSLAPAKRAVNLSWPSIFSNRDVVLRWSSAVPQSLVLRVVGSSEKSCQLVMTIYILKPWCSIELAILRWSSAVPQSLVLRVVGSSQKSCSVDLSWPSISQTVMFYRIGHSPLVVCCAPNLGLEGRWLQPKELCQLVMTISKSVMFYRIGQSLQVIAVPQSLVLRVVFSSQRSCRLLMAIFILIPLCSTELAIIRRSSLCPKTCSWGSLSPVKSAVDLSWRGRSAERVQAFGGPHSQTAVGWSPSFLSAGAGGSAVVSCTESVYWDLTFSRYSWWHGCCHSLAGIHQSRLSTGFYDEYKEARKQTGRLTWHCRCAVARTFVYGVSYSLCVIIHWRGYRRSVSKTNSNTYVAIGSSNRVTS